MPAAYILCPNCPILVHLSFPPIDIEWSKGYLLFRRKSLEMSKYLRAHLTRVNCRAARPVQLVTWCISPCVRSIVTFVIIGNTAATNVLYSYSFYHNIICDSVKSGIVSMLFWSVLYIFPGSCIPVMEPGASGVAHRKPWQEEERSVDDKNFECVLLRNQWLESGSLLFKKKVLSSLLSWYCKEIPL